MARRLDRCGANALVLFNRSYQPDFDLEALDIVQRLELSQSYKLLPRFCWVAILFGQIRADLAITGGVHTGTEVVKCMVAGARGNDYVRTLGTWNRAYRHHPRRYALLGGGTRIRIRQADAGKHGAALCRLPKSFRARELYESAQFLRPQRQVGRLNACRNLTAGSCTLEIDLIPCRFHLESRRVPGRISARNLLSGRSRRFRAFGPGGRFETMMILAVILA